MQIVRKGKPGRKQARKRMQRPFGFQPLERRALLAADLGADWETFVEPQWVDDSGEAQVWTDEKVAEDDISIRIRSFGGDEVDVKTQEEGEAPILYTLFTLRSEEGVEDGQVEDGLVEDGQVEDGQVEDGQVETTEFFDLAAASGPADVEIRTFGDLGEDALLFEATDVAAMSGEVFVGSGWHNPDAPHDVNADGYVSPIDALLLVTYLNDNGVGEFGEGEAPSIYPDIDGDGQLAPLDALLLFNYLNDNLPSLDGFQFAADEALPENEAAGLVAGRMALRDESLFEDLFDDASSATDTPQESDAGDAGEVDAALGRYAIWADDSSPDWFAAELSEKKSDDGSLEAGDLGDAASDELVDALIAK